MAEARTESHALGDVAARQLANVTKTPPQLGRASRPAGWSTSWVDAGGGGRLSGQPRGRMGGLAVGAARRQGRLPRELRRLRGRPARVHALDRSRRARRPYPRLGSLSTPHDQVNEQLRLAVEMIKERQEDELVNNAELRPADTTCARQTSTPAAARRPRTTWTSSSPTSGRSRHSSSAHPRGDRRVRPRVHPARSTAADGRRMFGSQFITWRGIPMVPCNKIPVERRARPDPARCAPAKSTGRHRPVPAGPAGRADPGPVGALHGHQPQAIASYLISLYCSVAVLTDDALGVLEEGRVASYHEYK